MDGGLITLIKQGGFAIYPLVLCSILGVAVVLERTYYLIKANKTISLFHSRWVQLIQKEKLDQVGQEAEQVYIGGLYIQAVHSQGEMEEKFLRHMDRARMKVVQDLKTRTWILGTIGSLAPFIGLFGTVVGILHAFREIAQTQEGGFTTVSSGISEALVATAAGIFVGVLAVVAYNLFSNLINQFSFKLKIISEELADLLTFEEQLQGNKNLSGAKK